MWTQRAALRVLTVTMEVAMLPRLRRMAKATKTERVKVATMKTTMTTTMMVR
jgi:hypothetical protein